MTREEAIQHFKEQLDIFGGEHAEAIKVAIEALKQVTGKLNNPDDSLLTTDSEARKEQKSKLDLISRAEAIEAMGEEPPVWCDEEYEIAERSQWRADIEAIKSVPSANRPKGKWKCMSDCGVTECDQCGWSIEEYVGDYNFCPQCGAKMDGERSER